VTWIITDVASFDAAVQQKYPSPDRQYIPILTQFGASMEQRIRLGDTQSHFAFEEVVVVGGIDQNIIIPSVSVLIGFRSHIGLEVGMGPNIIFREVDGQVRVATSVVYSVGWTFKFGSLYVPVNIAIVPTPDDMLPRLSVFTGFNFPIGK
jgi:hypothetical protein